MPVSSETCRRILVVDDCPDNASMLAKLLEVNGHLALGLTKPTALFLSVDEFSPDLILLDLSMPELDGFCAAAELRIRGFTKPIVAVTGYSAPGLRERAMAMGFNYFLLKPVRIEDVEQMLASLYPSTDALTKQA